MDYQNEYYGPYPCRRDRTDNTEQFKQFMAVRDAAHAREVLELEREICDLSKSLCTMKYSHEAEVRDLLRQIDYLRCEYNKCR